MTSSKILPFVHPDGHLASEPVDTPAIHRLKAEKQQRAQSRYVKGPISWPVIGAATRAHPKGLALYLAIKMLADTTGKAEVALQSALCADLGIGREMKRRILKALAAAGLIEIAQSAGQLTRVRLAPAGGMPQSQDGEG